MRSLHTSGGVLPPVAAPGKGARATGGVAKMARVDQTPSGQSNARENRHAYAFGGTTETAHAPTVQAAKLGSLEAQRVIAVLDELRQKVAADALIPQLVDKRQFASFPPEVISQLQTFRHLCGLVNNGQLEYDNGKDAVEALKSSARSLRRLLVQTPSLLAKLESLQMRTPLSAAMLDSLLQQLRDILYDRLCTTTEDDQQRRDTLTRISVQEYRMSSELQSLTDELNSARRERMAEVSKCNGTIKQLKEELRELKQQAEDNVRQMTNKSLALETTERTAAEAVHGDVSAQRDSLRTQLANARQANRDEELALRRRIFKIETEVENWIHKYDVDMEEKQVELDEISAIYSEESQELSQLTERYTELKREYDLIQADKNKQQQEETDRQERLAQQTQAAIKIQAFWRGCKVRMSLRKKRGKSGGKGKGKKGKKGKGSA